MEYKKPIPPKLAKRFLLWFLRDDLAEEVLGDLNEQFLYKTTRTSLFRARLNYWYQVFNYLRPFAINKSKSTNSNHYAMFQNYFKISWRNLTKQKMYSSIKVVGSALGITACLLIALFIRDELSYDRHYANEDQIYRVVYVDNDDGEIEKDVFHQAPFANALKDDYAEIVKAGRYCDGDLFGAGSKEVRRPGTLQNSYEKDFIYADQELLDILQIPMVYGDLATALTKPKTLVISKEKADKYFPHENPVGQTLILDNDEENPYTVGGVMKGSPANSHFKHDFLMTMSGVEFWPGEQTYWRASNYPTYVLLRPDTDPKQLEMKLKDIVKNYMVPSREAAGIADPGDIVNKISFELQPISDIHLKSANIDDELSHGDIRFVWLFGTIAVFILLIACINFVNLSTAKSANRAKEVGVRKVAGSSRGNLIRQFLTESVLYSFLSFALGILLAWLLLPYFNTMADKSLEFPWATWWLIPAVAATALVTGIFSGLYPSFYLSAFKPVQVLKGGMSRGSKSTYLRSILVIFQFTTSIVLIISTAIIFRQMNFILNNKLGFDKDQVLLLRGANTLGDKATTFKNALLKFSEVKNISVSDYLPIANTKRNGNGFWKEGKTQEDKPVYGQIWRVDHDYIKTMEMQIVEGRDFNPDMATDSQSIIINEKMAKAFAFENPLGQRITNSGDVWQVVGVVEDFHFETLKEDIRPLCLVIGNSPAIISVKVNTTDMANLIQSITAVWDEFSPNQPIRYTFMDEDFSQMYADVQRMGRIFNSFAILAIVVACMGLLALSTFMIEQRGKEISVRLVLGASFSNILRLLTSNFVKLVLISLIIAIPVGWLMMTKWLEDFVYKIDIGWDIFLFAGILVLIITILTVSYQSVKAALTNPVENLRSE